MRPFVGTSIFCSSRIPSVSLVQVKKGEVSSAPRFPEAIEEVEHVSADAPKTQDEVRLSQEARMAGH